MKPKRQHKTLSLAEKLEVITDLKHGVTVKQLIEKYGVGSSTISDIRKNEMKIQSFVKDCLSGPGKRKTLRKSGYPLMEAELYSWFLGQRDKFIPISQETLTKKAKELFVKHYGSDKFVASPGWIKNFKYRHGIKQLKMCDENVSNKNNVTNLFILFLEDKIKELNLNSCQIYSANISGLYWKLLPEKSLLPERRKTNKDCITFVTCGNASGSHKLKLLVVGKENNPRSLKNLQFPIKYMSSKNAWMTLENLKQWFYSDFIPEVRNFLHNHCFPEKALLLIDNIFYEAPETELISDGGKFVMIFLPQNCAKLIQPMERNVIRLTKLFYRKNMVMHILSEKQTEEDVRNYLKRITLVNAVYFLFRAWENLPAQTLEYCWYKLLPKHLFKHSSSYCENELKQKFNLDTKELENIATMLNDITSTDISISLIEEWINCESNQMKCTEDF